MVVHRISTRAFTIVLGKRPTFTLRLYSPAVHVPCASNDVRHVGVIEQSWNWLSRLVHGFVRSQSHLINVSGMIFFALVPLWEAKTMIFLWHATK